MNFGRDVAFAGRWFRALLLHQRLQNLNPTAVGLKVQTFRDGRPTLPIRANVTWEVL